jgi:fructose-1,6-bisphosphatase I
MASNKRHITLNEWLTKYSNYIDLNSVIIQIATACKIISSKVRRVSIDGLHGAANTKNYHGESVQTLDILSNNEFIDALSKNQWVHTIISEEDDNPTVLNEHGLFVVAYDPLDGSSNIDANVSIGSIFGISRTVGDIHFRGCDMICAGYALYSCSTQLVFAIDDKPQCFTLDESCGEFVLTYADIIIPKMYKMYSINEAYYNFWLKEQQELIDKFKELNYVSRYIGSMVADVHRTLFYGGIFMNIGSKENPDGKLRYMYEIAPMSYLIEKAGGLSFIIKDSALNHKPTNIHQRTPIYLGSSECVQLALSYHLI